MKRTYKKILSVFLTMAVLLSCFYLFGATASAASSSWAGAWGSPAIESGVVLGSDSVLSKNGIHLRDFIPANSTVRSTVTPTIGGTKIRLKFSNLYGKQSITINEATVAKTGNTDDEIITDTVTPVTFNGGHTSVTIAAGSEVYSDEISFSTTALEKISISTYFKSSTPMYVIGLYGGTSYLAMSLGNRTHKENLTAVASKLNFTSNSITYYTIPFLTRVDIYAPNAYSVVLLGDSTMTNDSYLLLAQKLHSNGIHNVGVVMSSIIGNSLLNDGTGLLGTVYGEATLKRAQRDAFEVAGVKYVIVKVGSNDVLHPMEESMKDSFPYSSTSQIIEGYRELSRQAAGKDISMYLCTRTPYKGYERNFFGTSDLTWTQKGEDMLLEINSWIKYASSGYYSGCINLDAMRDPDDSTKLRSQMTTDGIHFSHLGQVAFVDLIPEAAYGVNRELKDAASIRNENPYAAVSAAPSTTKQPSSSAKTGNATRNSSSENTAGSGAVISSPSVTSPQQETTASSAPNSSEPVSIENANQILVNSDNNNQPNTPVAGAAEVADGSGGSASPTQLAGFAILAAVAVAIIAVAAVLLVKMRPSRSAPLTRGSGGRAKRKKKV